MSDVNPTMDASNHNGWSKRPASGMRCRALSLAVAWVASGIIACAGCGRSTPPGAANAPTVPATHAGEPANPNDSSNRGLTAESSQAVPEPTTADIWQAADRGNVEDVRTFLARGADGAAKDSRGKTALQLALEKGHDDSARLLLQHGALLPLPQKDQQTPLIYAAKTDDLRLARLLIETSQNVDQTDDLERTPLVWAAEKGHLAVVELLLDKGADPNRRSYGNRTALHVAAKYGHVEVIDLLLKHGAELLAETSQHDTPATLALWAKHYDAAGRLVGPEGKLPPHPNNRTSYLAEAVTAGDMERVRFLVKHSDELEKGVGVVESTPLILAAEAGKTEIVHALIDAGANVNAATTNGWTSLHYAIQKGHAETAQLLIARGADTSVTNNLGKTPLEMNTNLQLKLPDRE